MEGLDQDPILVECKGGAAVDSLRGGRYIARLAWLRSSVG